VEISHHTLVTSAALGSTPPGMAEKVQEPGEKFAAHMLKRFVLFAAVQAFNAFRDGSADAVNGMHALLLDEIAKRARKAAQA
jgi:hypothetical protein